jgi:hypothetical protein
LYPTRLFPGWWHKNDPENKTQGVTFNTDVGITTWVLEKDKMSTAILPQFKPTKCGNSNSVLKKQQSLHSQKLRTIVVQKYHLRSWFLTCPAHMIKWGFIQRCGGDDPGCIKGTNGWESQPGGGGSIVGRLQWTRKEELIGRSENGPSSTN